MRPLVAACLAAFCWLGEATGEPPPIVYKDPPPKAAGPTVPDTDELRGQTQAPTQAPAPPPSEICSPDGAGKVLRLTQGTETALRYCGRITASGVDAFEAELRPDDRTLVITSYGGDLDAPLRMAEIVAARRMTVEVAGPCFSGCASFVFVAGERRIISPTGIIGFHNTASSAALLGLRANGDDAPAGFDPVLRRAGREWELYVARGVNFDLLYEPQVRIETFCTAPRGTHPTSGERVIDIASALDFWLPSAGALREFGVSYDGKVAESEREAARRFHAYMPEVTPVPKFTSQSRKLPVAPEMLLYSIDACSAPPPAPAAKPDVERAPPVATKAPEEPKRKLRDAGED